MSGAQAVIPELSAHSDLVKTIEAALPGKTSRPGSAAYETSNRSYFSVFEQEIAPACIAHPSNVEDVVVLVKALRPALAQGWKNVAAIKSGGYMTWAGAANVAGGVTIDLGGLKGVKLNEDKTTVSIGVGERWGNVYEELEKDGLTTVGGRVATLGVTGFILGGGISYYSAERGFACDFVASFELVLASGDIVQASRAVNPDLFRAVQGGSNNFGIITRIDMEVFKPMPKLYGGRLPIILDEKNIEAVFAAIHGLTVGEGEGSDHAHAICTLTSAMGMPLSILSIYETEGREDSPALSSFTCLEPKIAQIMTLRQDSQRGFCEEQGTFINEVARRFQITTTIKPSVELLRAIHKRVNETRDLLKDVPGLALHLNMQPVTKGLLQRSCERWAGYTSNSAGLRPEDGPFIIVLIFPSWESANDDQKMISETEKLVRDIQTFAQDKGLGHRYIFPNYAWTGQNVLAGYGEERLAELREAQQKWDPEGFFQTVIQGGFKISEA